MIYRQINPHPLLKQHIRCYWTMEGHAASVLRHTVISDYCMDIIYDLVRGEALVAGPAYGSYAVPYSGEISIFGIRFYPGAFLKLFGIPAAELYGLCVGMDEVGIDFPHLGSSAEADDVLLRMLGDDSPDAFSAELNSFGSSFLSEYSLKTVNRRMVERTGMSYGAYEQILRIHRSIRLMLHGCQSQADIAQLSGFYDQSHFIKTFRKHTGFAPLSFTNEINTGPVHFLQYPLGMY